MGGLITIDNIRDVCFQEDVVQFLATKIVGRVIKSAEKFSQYRLAHYVKIQMVELMFPERSLSFDHTPTDLEVQIRCGNKGAQLFESLETIFGTDSVLRKIKTLLREHSYHAFSMESFLSLLRFNIVDNVDLAQIYGFWFRSTGIANLKVEQLNERLRLTQLNVSFGNEHSPVLSPLRISVRNLTLPISFMLSQGLELAPLDSKLLPLTNFGYGNVYRVSYDSKTWERILRHLEESPQLFSPRSKAQLLGDFCYFSALGEIGPEEPMLRNGFLQLMRSESEHFQLCEYYALWCVAVRKGTHGKHHKNFEVLWPNFVRTLSNRQNYECAGMGPSSMIANLICNEQFGTDCI